MKQRTKWNVTVCTYENNVMKSTRMVKKEGGGKRVVKKEYHRQGETDQTTFMYVVTIIMKPFVQLIYGNIKT